MAGVLGILVVVAPVNAGDSPTWSDPQPLLPDDIPVSFPRVDLGQEGYAVSAWAKGKPAFCTTRCHPESSRVQVAVRMPENAEFDSPRRVGPGDTRGVEFGIAEDENTAVLVWQQRKQGILTRTHSPDTGFSPIEALTDSPRNFSFDIAHDGTAAVSWHDEGETVAVVRPSGGSFGSELSVPLDDEDGVSVAAGGGVAVVDDDDTVDSTELLDVSVLEPGQSGFGPPEQVPGLRGLVSWPRIQMAEDGTVAVLGDVEREGNFQIKTGVRPPGGEFGSAIDITEERMGSFPEVDADSTGRIVAVWQHYRRGKAVTPRASSYSTGSGWAPSERIAEPKSGLSHIDMSPSGRTIAGVDNLSPDPFIDALAVISDPEIAFGAPQVILENAARSALVQHDVAIADTGEAIAIWAETPYGGRSQIFVSTLAAE